MTTYKQTVLDIKDYISFEIAQIERNLEIATSSEQKMMLFAEEDALKDIQAIIKENGK